MTRSTQKRAEANSRAIQRRIRQARATANNAARKKAAKRNQKPLEEIS